MFNRFIGATDLSAASYELIKSLGPLKGYGARECPPRRAVTAKSSDEALPHSRRVLDEIGVFVTQLPQFLQIQEATHE